MQRRAYKAKLAEAEATDKVEILEVTKAEGKRPASETIEVNDNGKEDTEIGWNKMSLEAYGHVLYKRNK